MKAHRLFRYLPLLAIASVSADTFELKDGTKFEGTIVKEDGSDYIISVQVTKSIKDERRVPKANVVNQTAERKDETEFPEIAKLVPAPDLQTAEVYHAQANKVEAFIKKYPQSPKKGEALKVLAALQKEMDVVNAGGIKFEGKLMSANDRLPKAYALDAGIQAAEMKAAADKGDPVSALRAWTKLETGFQGSTAYRENIPYVVKLMKAQLTAVSSSLASFDARTKKRAEGLAAMSSSDRNMSNSALQEELDEYMARLEKDKAAGHKWPPLDAYVKAPLEETKRNLETEIRRLETTPTANLPKTEEAYDAAWAAVTKTGATQQDVSTALSNARSASLPQPYVDILTKAAPAPAPSN
ncbi:PTPDL family protein [Luteolibacter soli]|uniref:PTPDL family protein n=1 Tax=Luteolibacter soli TaxID=3135280 RepID=A0ABU9B0C4_9BACT